MTLEELKTTVESVCLAHKDIREFYVGNDYNIAEQITHTYPLVFYELPYFVSYNLNPQRQVDNVQFAFNVFVESNWDNINEDHSAISRAKEIGDSIVTYLNDFNYEIAITSVDATSVREYSNDSVAGMRFELVVQLPRTFCDSTNFKTIFNL